MAQSSSPLVWRQRFPTAVQRNLASTNNPHGVTNSDLELAATIMQHDAICHTYDVRECTLHTGTDNQATQVWQQRFHDFQRRPGVPTAAPSRPPTVPSLYSTPQPPVGQAQHNGGRRITPLALI
jgi:hypothetical protein